MHAIKEIILEILEIYFNRNVSFDAICSNILLNIEIKIETLSCRH